MLSSSMYLISISGTGICEAESAVDCDSCLWFYARVENRNVDRIFSGLLIDIQFGTVLGLYALIYLMIGYVNGLFSETYFDEDIKLPLLLIAGSEFVYGLLIYFLMFMLRGEFDFVYYLMHVIIPELIYTVGVTLILYQLILWINQKLEAEEKRSASKFV